MKSSWDESGVVVGTCEGVVVVVAVVDGVV